MDHLRVGQQQIVEIAKALSQDARILILDEPSRSIDIGAEAAVFRTMRDLAAEGLGILFLTSDLDEVLTLSDRILVMTNERISGAFLAGTEAATVIVSKHVALKALSAIGMTFVIITGGIDLSVGSIVGPSAILAGWPVLNGVDTGLGQTIRFNTVEIVGITLLVGILSDGLVMMGAASFWKTVIKGVVIVLAVVIDQAQSPVAGPRGPGARGDSRPLRVWPFAFDPKR